MKRALVAFAAALAIFLSACGRETENSGKRMGEDDTIKVLATVFPEYDWVREVLGENPSHVQLDLLVDSGMDLHSYQPTVKDIMEIASCDLFIYVGGESDAWVAETLKQTERPGRETLCLLEILGDKAKEEELTEGMETQEEHGAEEEKPEYDEHVWLSVRNAGVFCQAIAGKLSQINPGFEESYQENAKTYVEKLNRLDQRYQETVDKAGQKMLLFGDRFPFRYMTDDYGISYYAAFAGCSAESEVSFQTVAFLAKQADRWNLSSILTIRGGDQKIARTIRQNTRSGDQEILELDSMQAVTAEEIQGGMSYLSIMERNREVLEKALETK